MSDRLLPHRPARLLLGLEWLWVLGSVGSAIGVLVYRFNHAGLAGLSETLRHPLLLIILLVLASVHWFIISDLSIGGQLSAFLLGTKFLAVFAVAAVMAAGQSYFWPLYALLIETGIEVWLAYRL